MIIEARIVLTPHRVELRQSADESIMITLDRNKRGRGWAERLAARLWNKPTGHLVRFTGSNLTSDARDVLADHIIGGAK